MITTETDIIGHLATWMQTTHESKVAAVQLPMGLGADLVYQAVERAGIEPVYVSMSGMGGVDLDSAARSPIAVTFKKKVIIVLEFDAIVSSDPTIAKHVAAAIKLDKVQILLVAHSFRAKAADLPKGHAFFEVQVNTDPHYEVRKVSKFDSLRDSIRDKGLAGAEAALQGIMQDYRGDGIAMGGVFDNYLVNGVDYQNIAEAFSWSDAVSEGMCRAGNYDDQYTFVPVTMTALAFADAPKHGTVTTFGTVWSKMNAMYAKVNSSRALVNKMRESGSRSTWGVVQGFDALRGMMQSRLAENDIEGAARVARSAGLDSASVLALMRLWKSKYSLAMHAKVKKLLDAD